MANALYDKGREGILDGSISVPGDAITCLLATSGYTPNLATHQFVSDIGPGNIVARSGAFASKTMTGGVFDAADITLGSVSGSAVTYLVLYKNTGTDATSRLIGIIDTATNLPITPNGGSITIAWDAGANRIFKL
jgi:hypothetical protein